MNPAAAKRQAGGTGDRRNKPPATAGRLNVLVCALVRRRAESGLPWCEGGQRAGGLVRVLNRA